ncbi:MAG TPA: HAMP domain-containing sensor histidine kinase [Polyangiaceae bacterium]|nr:HAMP domain-containing sensor histidine kinase [Polyangiaceae bacterium]
MRLFLRILIGNIAPVLVVTLALGFTLIALLRMTSLLDSVNTNELETLRFESTTHRRCWEFDVAMRRAERACVASDVTPEIRASIDRAAEGVRDVAMSSGSSGGHMREVARRHLELYERMHNGDLCATLLDRAIQQQRSSLDETLTDSWDRRLEQLYERVAAKGVRARDIGLSAASIGMAAAFGSVLLALLLARNMARSVNVPLLRLADLMRQVGSGEFGRSVEVHGPAEIEMLASELEQMRLQLAKLEALKQGFLASVSHELRTPLSKIREALALLGDGAVGDLDPRQARVVEIARVACEREIRLVTTLLDLSRLRTGSPLRFRAGCSVDDVLDSALADERPDAQAGEVTIQVSRDGTLPSCRLDAALLERAIANLVRNAVSVSQRGQSVRVSRTYTPASDGRCARVRIEVSDDGPGVPREIRETVFQAFVTSSVPGSPKAIGIGLGLALAREVARAHGGELSLGDDSGAGATFVLSLPLDPRTTSDENGSDPSVPGFGSSPSSSESSLPA